VVNWIVINTDLIGTTVALLAFLVSLGSLAVSAYRFVELRRAEQEQRNFENYHKLIAETVEGARNGQVMKLYSQVAVIFELRNFKKYKSVTARILNGLMAEWLARKVDQKLIDELRLTIDAVS